MSNSPAKTAAAVIGVAGVVLLIVILRPGEKAPPPKPVAPPKTEAAAPMPAGKEEVVVIRPTPVPEQEMKEIKYLPEKVTIVERERPAVLNMPELKQGNRRVVNVRQVTNKEKDGSFLNPRWSPDGLQMIVSRPGYDGVYVVNADGSNLRRVCDSNGYSAKWTPEGNIEVTDADGQVLTYSPDGTLMGRRAKDDTTAPAFAANDAVFIRREDGTQVPLSTSDDKFFNPQLSPDGKMVVYQGLATGLYMAPTDGSKPPVYVGHGNNPTWAPDGSGVVFEVTTDDGHNLTGGDVYYVDSEIRERTNMTPNDSHISQFPTIGPDGRRIAYESEGVIYIGEVQ